MWTRAAAYNNSYMPFTKMKQILLYILILISFNSYSQDDTRTFDELDEWAGQAKYEYELLKRFDKYCRENNLLTSSLSMIDADSENSWDYMKSVDLNNDGLYDVVYSGPNGGESNIVYFFIQTNSGFEKVFEAMQGVNKVTWSGELLDKVLISDWGCCAEIHLINSVFEVDYDNQNKPVFTKIYQTIEVDEYLVKPKHFFKEPIEFEVDNEDYKLRLSPLIDDTTNCQWLDLAGNTIATLRTGTQGIALASKTDETGRTWWYVAIEQNENVKTSILPTTDYPSTKIIGWLSSRYVTEN